MLPQHEYEVSGELVVRYDGARWRQAETLIAEFCRIAPGTVHAAALQHPDEDDLAHVAFSGRGEGPQELRIALVRAIYAFTPVVCWQSFVTVDTRSPDGSEDRNVIEINPRIGQMEAVGDLDAAVALLPGLSPGDLRRLADAANAAIAERAEADAITISEVRSLLVIEARSWFRRPDFVAFLNDPLTTTWHGPGEPDVGEFADVFVVLDDHGSGDAETLPDDIWAEILSATNQRGLTNCVVRIINRPLEDL